MPRPMQLGTIELTYYILKLLKNGVTTEDLCKCLEGEYNLVWAYLRLFDEFDWIEKQGNMWILTSTGTANIFRFHSGE